MRIMRLNKKMALENIDRLIEIDKVVLDKPWTEDNFLVELKGKWKHSIVALEGTDIQGFVICSIKGENLHIHRIAVSPEYQGRGVGTALVEDLFDDRSEYGMKYQYITVRTKKYNTEAQKFYKMKNFKRIGSDGPDYVYKKVIE